MGLYWVLLKWVYIKKPAQPNKKNFPPKNLVCFPRF